MPVKAVIWDMGGVILQMGDEAPRQTLAADYSVPLERIYWEIFDSPSAQQATIGHITIEEHWQNVGCSLEIPSENMRDFLRQFWSSDTIDFQLIDLIHLLRRDYKTGVLSNAWDNLRDLMETEWKITGAFDNILISAEVGLAKPDPQIYQLAAEKLGVLPGEAVFIDDLARNIQAAQAVGFRTIQFISRSQVLRDLQRIIAANGQILAQDIQHAIETLRRCQNGRPPNPYDLIQLQIELEYQLDAQDHIVPYPGSSEQTRLLIYQSANGAWPFFHRDLPTAIREEILGFGLKDAFVSPQKIQNLLASHGSFKPNGPFHTYYFPHSPAADEFPAVQENGGRFEVLVDQVPVSWAWSVRENQYCAEVAVETLPAFRKRGLARQATAAWGQAILGQGRMAFYSHAADNQPSRALARSLGLTKFAECIGFE